MEKIGLSSDVNINDINEELSNNIDKYNRNHALSPYHLRPLVQSNLWEMTIAFETVRSCTLASQHLEIRRCFYLIFNFIINITSNI
jgi:hypothetical protein